jgi:hypothetical protein
MVLEFDKSLVVKLTELKGGDIKFLQELHGIEIVPKINSHHLKLDICVNI